MDQELRVGTADLHAMATRWGGLTDGLGQVTEPLALGLSCQSSAAAVEAAHGEVTAFAAGLAALVNGRAAGVVTADARYIAQEAASSTALAAIFERVVNL